MAADPLLSCPRCAWPEAEPYEIVSRHVTSEGVISYSRCICGRLQVRRSGSVVIRARRAAPGGSVIGRRAAGCSPAS